MQSAEHASALPLLRWLNYVLYAYCRLSSRLGVSFSQLMLTNNREISNKYREVASGVALAVHFIGSTAGSPVAQLVLENFGLKGLALLYACVGLFMVFSPILLRPPSQDKSSNIQGGENSKSMSKTSAFFGAFRLLKSQPRLTLWISVMTFGYLGYYVVSVHLVRYAECTLKVGTSRASLLLTYVYVSGAAGSVICGILGHFLKRPLYFQLVLIISGIVNICFPLFASYGLLILYSVLFGLFISMISLTPVIVPFLIGERLACQGLVAFSFCYWHFGSLWITDSWLDV
eukprot:m.136703 g.136703  ORF g.136703 m.136703 type:complete len:288 (+) comp38183_c0_seq5:275-1138(+)